MSYSISKAKLIAEQLERLATQNVYQLAGQLPNLDFWVNEAESALAVVDDYPRRFNRLRDAQVAWVKAHGTRVSDYCAICRGGCEFGPKPPSPPHRIDSHEMAQAQTAIRQAIQRYLVRLFRTGFVDEPTLEALASRLDLPLEPEDYELAQDNDGEP